MSLSVGKTNLLLRNLLRTPILELEASKLNLGAFLTATIAPVYSQCANVWLIFHHAARTAALVLPDVECVDACSSFCTQMLACGGCDCCLNTIVP